MTRGRKQKPISERKRKRRGQTITMNADDFKGKTPEARANQLANLRQYSGKSKPKVPKPDMKALESCDIIEFATEYLGVSFAERPAQEVILRCLYGLPLTMEQIVIYRQLTTNEQVFEHNVEKTEADLAIGARGGKSFMVSVITLYESIVKGDHWRKFLRDNEVGYAVITATRQKQCEDIIQASCTSLLENSSLKYYIEDALTAELKLTNGLAIVSMPCNSTAGRGLPIFLLIFDEIAHYRTEGVKADETIHNALRPRQAQFPMAKCLKISTPAGKQGLFWEEFDEGFQVPGRLTIQAPTRLVNPVIPQDFIDKEYKRDPDNARREFGAEFAETMSGFFESCIEQLKACFVLIDDVPFDSRYRYYCGIDQSGLSGRDRFAMSIAHSEGKKTFVDVNRTWSTSDGDAIIAEIRDITKPYGINSVALDRYAGGWVKQAFERQGIEVEVRDLLPPIYINLKSLVIAGRVSLPDTKGLRSGLLRTQAFYGRSNQLSIGHERTAEGHGDEADSTATAVWLASKSNSDGLFYV